MEEVELVELQGTVESEAADEAREVETEVVEDKAEEAGGDSDGKEDEVVCESLTTLISNTERESGGQRSPGEGVSCPSAKREISCKIESFGENPASPSKANSRRSIKAREASVCEIAQIESGVSVEFSVIRVGDESEEINFLNTLSSAT